MFLTVHCIVTLSPEDDRFVVPSHCPFRVIPSFLGKGDFTHPFDWGKDGNDDLGL